MQSVINIYTSQRIHYPLLNFPHITKASLKNWVVTMYSANKYSDDKEADIIPKLFLGSY